MNDSFDQAGQHRTDLLGVFAKHPVAANLLMAMMILAGAVALKKLNVQFFPTFELEVVSVSTIWSGASAEDVETGITIPLEQRLRNVDRLKEITSTSAPGVSGMTGGRNWMCQRTGSGNGLRKTAISSTRCCGKTRRTSCARRLETVTAGWTSSAPRIATGMIGTPVVSARWTNPPRPKRCTW